MENLENNNEDDANVHDDVAMNNETGDGNANEDENNNTGGQVVEEYLSTPRILNVLVINTTVSVRTTTILP